MNDEGSLDVVEAVLAAMLVMGTLLFVNVTMGAPASPGGATQEDVADAILAELYAADFEGAPIVGSPTAFGWPDLVLDGSASVQAALRAFLDDRVPSGFAYRLSLANGFGVLPIVEPAPPPPGVDIDGAERPWLAATTVNDLKPSSPGEPHGLGLSINCIEDPYGRQGPPKGASWIERFEAGDHVPAEALHGEYRAYTTSNCVGGFSVLHVGLIDDASGARGTYFLVLEVWRDG